MKKLFLTCAMLVSSLCLFAAGLHVPAAGPVQLGDAVAGGVVRGAIMQAVIHNNPVNPNANPILAAANAAIAVFDGNGQNFRAYQTIVTNIGQAVNSQAAVDAVKAFERVIMHLYDYDAYLIGGYKPGVSIFLTGVRVSWINPVAYFSPKSYFSDNNARLKQLIDELDKLADVVKIHSVVEYARIKATVHSYRHWRRNTMLSIAAYLAVDAYRHGYKNSIVNQYWQGGLDNAGEIAINHISNIGSGLWYTGKGFSKCAQGVWNVGCKVGDFVLHGKKAFAKNNPEPQAEQNKEIATQSVACQLGMVKEPKPVIEKISVDGSMTDFEKARFDAFEKEGKTIVANKQPITVNKQPQEITSRKVAWNSVKSSVVKALTFEVDAREKRKEIWNGRLARLKNVWNEVSTKDAAVQIAVVQVPVVQVPVVSASVNVEKKPIALQQPKELPLRETLKNQWNVLANLITGQDEKKMAQKQVSLMKQIAQDSIQNLNALPGKLKQHIQDSDDFVPSK